ncbi:MAG: HD domain-containing protein [Sporomusaceae bacterium]|nr:HD domain-containing protein [Sporomusaceae bacterium]
MKERFISLLQQVERNGIEEFIAYLEQDTDFFSAPASAYHHGNYMGGLVDHSVAVYDNLVKIIETFDLSQRYDKETLILSALLHDLCKANFYRKVLRNRKNEKTGQWEKVEIYEINDQFPIGHGEKSVILLSRYIALTEDEMLAIRWHMGGFDDAARAYTGGQSLSKAMKSTPLVAALHMADMATCYFKGV